MIINVKSVDVPDIILGIGDDSLGDPKFVTVAVQDCQATFDITEVYRALIPFMAKLTPQQAGVDKV
jgi:hypothetical protein